MTSRLAAVVVVLLSVAARGADSWPQFRGPDGTGHSDAKGLPLVWDESKNIVWKTAIHDLGWSSPVVYGKQVWLTSASKDGRELFVLCLDRETGKVLKDWKLFDVAQPQFIHSFNTPASPTAVIEEGQVYITFGSAGTAAIDTKTFRVVWQRRDIECNHFRGAGSSPILFQNLLLMHFDGSDVQFVMALDKKTGKTVWQTKRSIDFQDLDKDGKPAAEGDMRKAFATPHVARINGRWEMISLGAKAAYSYDPLTGKELWRVKGTSMISVPTPFVANGLIYVFSGYSRNIRRSYAIRPGAVGDITGSKEAIAWMREEAPYLSTPVIVGDQLFTYSTRGGIMASYNALTGATLYQQRLGLGTPASASMQDQLAGAVM